MKILRQKFFSKKEEKENKSNAGKKEAIAAGVLGAGAIGADVVSNKYASKANELSGKAFKAGEAIAAKTGTKLVFPGMVSGSPEAVKRATELSKRYDSRLARGINQAAKGAKIAGRTGQVLGAASLGAGGVAVYKKLKNSKKDDNSKK